MAKRKPYSDADVATIGDPPDDIATDTPPPDDRCGYLMAAANVPDLGAACCTRPVYEDNNRCLWHVDIEGKHPDVFDGIDIGERLDGAILRSTSFADESLFAGRVLVDADFDDATLTGADFTASDLRYATFRNADARGAAFVNANLEEATLTDTDLRGAFVERARLYEAVLNARINRRTSFGRRCIYDELARGTDDVDDVRYLGEAAMWTYNELQRLSERHGIIRDSHQYHIRGQDMRRRVAWKLGSYPRALQLEGARFVMRYGRSPWRVIGTSVALILVCAFIYPLTAGFQETRADSAVTYSVFEPTDAPVPYLTRVFLKSLYFSVITFATLGYGDIRPVGGMARAVASVESFLGAVLMALLVFVLTRSVT